MSKPEIVPCAPVRTPIGTYGGALKDTPATVLGAAAVRETLRRAGHRQRCTGGGCGPRQCGDEI